MLARSAPAFRGLPIRTLHTTAGLRLRPHRGTSVPHASNLSPFQQF